MELVRTSEKVIYCIDALHRENIYGTEEKRTFAAVLL
jgi:hypothetical protein